MPLRTTRRVYLDIKLDICKLPTPTLFSFSMFVFRKLDLPNSKSNEFDVVGYKFGAKPESSRPPRLVRVGIIQNHIGNSTVSCNVPQERSATYDRVEKLINAAGESGVNVLCLQEAWRK